MLQSEMGTMVMETSTFVVDCKRVSMPIELVFRYFGTSCSRVRIGIFCFSLCVRINRLWLEGLQFIKRASNCAKVANMQPKTVIHVQ
jgi:hypothetical protein